ncbi:MAG: ArsR/SmtB family transcription factor [Nitrososphaerales archaeon]
MQTGASITDAKLKENVLKAVADEYSRAILTSTVDRPKSIVEISSECKIPMSTAYRRVHELEEVGLVQATRSVISEDGKRYYLYRSRIKAVRTTFGIDSLSVEIIPNEDMGRSAYW